MQIYKTTCLVNGKIYIGQERHNRSTYLGSGVALWEAIKVFGKDKFQKEILCNCSNQKQYQIDRQLVQHIKNLITKL